MEPILALPRYCLLETHRISYTHPLFIFYDTRKCMYNLHASSSTYLVYIFFQKGRNLCMYSAFNCNVVQLPLSVASIGADYLLSHNTSNQGFHSIYIPLLCTANVSGDIYILPRRA